MSSLRLTLAARSNGARSRGPATPEGKRRSSQNATRHGLLARCIVMENESSAAFEALLAQHCDRLQPADPLEFGFIEEMAAAYWRMRRTWALETRIYENHAKAQPPGDEINRMTAVITDPANHAGLGLMHRYETRLHCIYQRALQNFLLLRLAIPNEPIPISEHPDDLVQLSPADDGLPA